MQPDKAPPSFNNAQVTWIAATRTNKLAHLFASAAGNWKHHRGRHPQSRTRSPEMGQKVESQESPLTRQHREYTLGSWRTMINLFRPDLGEGKHWHGHCALFRPYVPPVLGESFFCSVSMVQFIPQLTNTLPRKGYTALRSTTLASWWSRLIFCINRFTADPDTGNRVG